ncbi:hypothetical protein WICPIJ_007741 [Wickerhamomyces pijperi]|uniref:Uncharacterized protein n=1 Tax=Wickerhamomyces pijperi TaxID=599730 RepID=A0A9P8PZN6_WICPI|nr:hypothetical protein WICPIJ_007741 [Wickerhamomyces pijperi]
MEVVALAFFLTTCTVATICRLLRQNYESSHTLSKDDRIIPLEGNINRLLFTIHDRSTIFIKSEGTSGTTKTIYKLERTGTNWHLYTCYDVNNQKLVSTLNNSVTEKFVVLNNTSNYNRQSPLNTSISIMKLNFNWFLNLIFYNWWFQYDAVAQFSFGSDTIVSWEGLRYLEIITKERKVLFTGLNNNNNNTSEGSLHDSAMVNLRQRVVEVSDYDNEINGFVLAFDYSRINMEIMLSTFLIALLVQSYRFDWYVSMAESKLRRIVNRAQVNNMV